MSERSDWIGSKGRRGTTPLFEENRPFVHKTVVPINLIKLTKINTNIASVQNKKEGFIYNRLFYRTLQLFLTVGVLIHKESEEGANHTPLRVRFET